MLVICSMHHSNLMSCCKRQLFLILQHTNKGQYSYYWINFSSFFFAGSISISVFGDFSFELSRYHVILIFWVFRLFLCPKFVMDKKRQKSEKRLTFPRDYHWNRGQMHSLLILMTTLSLYVFSLAFIEFIFNSFDSGIESSRPLNCP